VGVFFSIQRLIQTPSLPLSLSTRGGNGDAFSQSFVERAPKRGHETPYQQFSSAFALHSKSETFNFFISS
jgi:hypothetical protein